MLRKFSLIAVAAASLGVAALAPTLRLRLGWLARRMASRLGMGRPPDFCRRPGLLRRRLWLRRLLCAAVGSVPLGTPPAADQSLLLIPTAQFDVKRPRSRCGRGFCLPPPAGTAAAFI